MHGILQARTLEWVAISFSRGSSRSRDCTHRSSISCIGRLVLHHQRHPGGPRTITSALKDGVTFGDHSLEVPPESRPPETQHLTGSGGKGLDLAPWAWGLHSGRNLPAQGSWQHRGGALPATPSSLPETRGRQTSRLAGVLQQQMRGVWGRETGRRHAAAAAGAAAGAGTSWRPAHGTSQTRTSQHTSGTFSGFLFHR